MVQSTNDPAISDLRTLSDLQQREEIAVFVSWLTLGAGMIWILFSLYLGSNLLLLASLFPTSGAALAILLVKSGWSVSGRMITIIMSALGPIPGAMSVHNAAHIEHVIFVFVGVPFLFFSATNEKRYIGGLVGLILLVWSLLNIFDMNAFGMVEIGRAVAEQIVKPVVSSTVLIMLMAQMWAFARLTSGYSRNLLDANIQAWTAGQTKGNFLANMSHEIRTPMNGVIGIVEVLEQGKLDTDQKRLVRTIRDSSFSLLRIVDDILDTSKINAGKLKVHPAPMEFQDVFEKNGRRHADTVG